MKLTIAIPDTQDAAVCAAVAAAWSNGLTAEKVDAECVCRFLERYLQKVTDAQLVRAAADVAGRAEVDKRKADWPEVVVIAVDEVK